MPEKEKYFHCWVAKCKTEKCETEFVLQVFAEEEPPLPSEARTIYVLRECRAFQETCPNCHQAHTYSRGDIEPALLANQPLGFQSPAFAQARAPREQGSATPPDGTG
jgi:hypothetical protein